MLREKVEQDSPSYEVPDRVPQQNAEPDQNRSEIRASSILSRIEKNFSIGKSDKAGGNAADWNNDFGNGCTRFKITLITEGTRSPML